MRPTDRGHVETVNGTDSTFRYLYVDCGWRLIFLRSASSWKLLLGGGGITSTSADESSGALKHKTLNASETQSSTRRLWWLDRIIFLPGQRSVWDLLYLLDLGMWWSRDSRRGRWDLPTHLLYVNPPQRFLRRHKHTADAADAQNKIKRPQFLLIFMDSLWIWDAQVYWWAGRFSSVCSPPEPEDRWSSSPD